MPVERTARSLRGMRVACVVLLVASVITLGGKMVVHVWFAEEMPRVSDPSSGRTVETVVMRGTKVFVTPQELKVQTLAQTWSPAVGLLCLLAAGILITRFGLFRTKRE
jgi:hypothetical protein